MQAECDRRGFLKRSVLASAGAAAVMRSGAAEAAQGQEPAAGAAGMPMGRIGKLRISRLISGGNVFSGWTHSRDLKYVSSLAKGYNTDEKALATLELCEEHGVNTIIAGASHLIQKHWKERGGKMQWIAQTHPRPEDLTGDIARAIDGGACAAYVQGAIADRWTKEGRVELLGKCLEFIRTKNVPGGIGAHSLEVVKACLKAGIAPDFYMKTFHHDRYWSATPKDKRIEFDVDTNSPTDHDNMWCIHPEETIEVMSAVEAPWIAFKVLAAGAIPPQEGFTFAFENGADFICAGMFDFQVAEDALIAKRVLSQVRRTRPWRA